MVNFLQFLYPVLTAVPVLLALLLLYFLYGRIRIALVNRLVYNRTFSEEGVFEGDGVQIIETIYNPSFLPVLGVEVESYIHGGLQLKSHADVDDMQPILSRFHIPPFTKINRRHEVRCRRRGYYTMNSASVLIRGFRLDHTKYFAFASSLYVYPQLTEHGQASHPVNLLSGSSLSFRQVLQDPFSTAGVRDYASGDPFRMIHFKATAKYSYRGENSIKVHKYDYASDRVFMVYLNFQIPEEGLPTKEYEAMMEQALSLAASFAAEALRCGYRVGLAANCRMANGDWQMTFPISGGTHHIEEILRKLAMVQIRCGISFAALLDGGVKNDIAGAEIFVLTPYVDETTDESLTLLQRTNTVTVIRL